MTHKHPVIITLGCLICAVGLLCILPCAWPQEAPHAQRGQAHQDLKRGADNERYQSLNLSLSTSSVDGHVARRVWQVRRRGESELGRASHITGLAPAPYQQLWIGTYAGLLRFDGADFHEVTARKPQPPYSPISTSSVTAITPAAQGDDLFLSLKSRGVWRFSPRGEHGVMWPVSGEEIKRATIFQLSALGDLLLAATSSGLKLLDTRASRLPARSPSATSRARASSEHTLISEAQHSISATYHKRDGSWEIFTCGREGVYHLTLKPSEAQRFRWSVVRDPKLIFRHPDSRRACRGVVATPQALRRERHHAGEVEAFALFEDSLFLLRRGAGAHASFQAYQLSLSEAPLKRALWRQRPYIDPLGTLWVPSEDELLQLGPWREVRSRALKGEAIHTLTRLSTRAPHTVWRSQHGGGRSPLWVGSLGEGLHQALPLAGRSMRPLGAKYESGAGPISLTGDRFWWVESCNQLLTAARSRASEDGQGSLSAPISVQLPALPDGGCVDAMSDPERDMSARLYIARRSEVLALDVDEPSGQAGLAEVSIRERWSLRCDDPHCRITSITPLAQVSAGIYSLATSPKRGAPSQPESQLIAGTQDGRILSLTSGEPPKLIVNLNDHVDTSISEVKAIRFDERAQALLIAHHEGVLVVGDSLDSLDIQKRRPRLTKITHYAEADTPIGPARDLTYDPALSHWWVSSYGGGVGAIFWDTHGALHAEALSTRSALDHFISGVQPTVSGVMLLGNQGATHLGLYRDAQSTETRPRVQRLERSSIGEANGWLSPNHATSGDLLLTATTRGAVLLNLKELKEPSPAPPPQITSLSYALGSLECDHPKHSLEMPLLFNRPIELPRNVRELCLRFASPYGVNAPPISSQYRLTPEGISEDRVPWVSVRNSYQLRLSQLRDRAYTLELRAISDGDAPSQISRLRFVVDQPFMTRYARWVWGGVISLCLLGLLRARASTIRARRELKRQASASATARAETHHYWQVFEHAEQALLIYNSAGQCVEFNPRALNLFGVSASLFNQLTPGELGLGSPHLLNFDERDYHDMPMLCQRPGGVPFPARVSYHRHSSLYDEDGVLISIVDLSTLVRAQDHRLEAQRALARSRKLESLGRLAGWVTHEVNNIFGVLEGFLESAYDDHDAPRGEVAHQSSAYVDMRRYLERERQRLQVLTGLDYQRRGLVNGEITSDSSSTLPSDLRPLWVRVDELFDKEFDLLSWLLSDHQTLEWCSVDPAQRRLIRPNASTRWVDKSIFDLLMVRIILGLSEEDAKLTSFRVYVADLDHSLQISLDLPELALSQLTPQLSPVSQSRDESYSPLMLPGLDLDLLWGSLLEDIERFQCEVSLSQNRLSILFPLSHSERSPSERAHLDNDLDITEPSIQPIHLETSLGSAAENSDRIGSELDIQLDGVHLLLVDDNQELLKLLSARLRRVGFTLQTFTDSREAAVYLRETEEPPHLLITDVLMPHLNGRQLADLYQGLSSQALTLFISAYTDDVLSPEGEFKLGLREQLLRKPFTPKQLCAVVVEILRRAALTSESPDL